MKKILLILAIASIGAVAMAQTTENVEKAVSKKEAKKLAKRQLSDGMALRAKVALYKEAISEEEKKGALADTSAIAEDYAELLTSAFQGIDLLSNVLSNNYVKDDSKVEANGALIEMAGAVVGIEHTRFEQKRAYNHSALVRATYVAYDASVWNFRHFNNAYAKASDTTEQMEISIKRSVAKLSLTVDLFNLGNLVRVCLECKDMENAQKAADTFIKSADKYSYAFTASNREKMAQTAYAMAALLYKTAYNDEDWEMMNKYYELASNVGDEKARSFVIQSMKQYRKEHNIAE